MTAPLDGDPCYVNMGSVSQSITGSFANKKAAATFVKKVLTNVDLDEISQLIMTTYWDTSGDCSVTTVTITCLDDTYGMTLLKLNALLNT